MSKATLNLSAIASTVGKLIGELHQAEQAVVSKLEEVNTQIKALIEQKAKFGKTRRTCPLSQACFDSMLASGLAEKTCNNYLSLVRTAVNEGTLLKSLRHDAKNGKGKKGKGKASKSALADLLVKAFNHDSGKSFETLCTEIEAGFNDAKFETLYEGFADYLKEQGYDLSE